MNNFQKVRNNTIILSIAEVCIKFFGFLWVTYLARNLSVATYGTYTLINSIVAVFSFLPDLGTGLIVIREIAKEKSKAAQILGNAFILQFLLALLTVALIYITSASPATNTLLLIASLTLFISALRSVAVFYFEGTERMKYVAFFNTFNSLLLLSGGAIGFLWFETTYGIFWGMLIGTCISCVLNWSILLKNFLVPKFAFNQNFILYLIKQGLPLGLASFSYIIYSRIDSVILNTLLGSYSVGIYNAATPFVFALMQLLNVPFMVSLYPALSRLSLEYFPRFVTASKKSLVFIALWSFAAAIFLSIASPFLLPMFFGQKYTASIPVLQIIIFFVPFASLSALLYKILIILHKQYAYLFISLAGATINVLLNLFMIPRFSIMGAAYASVVTQIALFVLYFYFVVYYIKQYEKSH